MGSAKAPATDPRHLMRALREAWEEEQDMEKLRLRKRLQELHGEVKRLERLLAEERGEMRRVA